VIDGADRPPVTGGALERALDRVCRSRMVPGNAVTHLHDGPGAFAAMLRLVDGARRWIHFENYIIRGDETGREFATHLAAAARRGVEVRLLFDRVGSRRTPRSFWRELRHSGVRVRPFGSGSLLHPLALLRRDHRKYLGVDGTDAVVGGICIGNEWAGNPARGIPPWRDTAVHLEGPVVPALEWAFFRQWERAGGEEPTYGLPSKVDACGTARLRVIEGIPGGLRLYRAIEILAAGAAERLWITDAYLVVATPIFATFRAAARDGLDVRLLVPGHTDLPAIRALTRVGYRELLEAGVRIWEWHGPMLHAKTVVIDETVYKVGSSNLNPSSFLSNYELDVLIENAAVAGFAARQFRHDLALAAEIVLRPLRAPEALQPHLPPAVVRAGEAPDWERPARAPGERSRRAVIALRKVAQGAQRSIAGAVAFTFLGVGLLFVALPNVMAYALAVVSFGFGLVAVARYLQRRQDVRD
jgi:cardiolipin synthase